MKLLSVMIGGFFGAICRFALSEWIHTNYIFPFATLITNLSGCFLIGWFLTYVSQKKKINPEWVLLFSAGFIASFTTFSTFSVEIVQLFQNGKWMTGLFYGVTSTVFGIVLAFAGYKIALLRKEK